MRWRIRLTLDKLIRRLRFLNQKASNHNQITTALPARTPPYILYFWSTPGFCGRMGDEKHVFSCHFKEHMLHWRKGMERMNPFFESVDANEVIRHGMQYYAGLSSVQLDLATMQLKARRDPLLQAHNLTVLDTTGQPWHCTFLLEQKKGQWYIKAGGGRPGGERDEPPELHDYPWIRLKARFFRNEFYAYGEVFDKGYRIVRVRLLDQGGLVLEDTVRDGMVLFSSEQLPTVPPLQLELYNDAGRLVSRQTERLRSPPFVTKEI
jgi:hypothetical protein